MPNPLKGFPTGITTDKRNPANGQRAASRLASQNALSPWAQHANQASKLLLGRKPLASPLTNARSLLIVREQSTKNPFQVSLGATRSLTQQPPLAELVARYQPILESALEQQNDIIEIAVPNETNLASFIDDALKAQPGMRGLGLQNGYTIERIELVRTLENPNLKTYQIIGNQKITIPGLVTKYRVLLSVYQASLIKSPSPDKFKVIMGTGLIAESAHYGYIPREMRGGLTVFSPHFPEYSGLFATVEKLKILINKHIVSQPKDLLKAINNELQDRGVSPDSAYIEQVKTILIERFAKKHPGFEQELAELQKPSQRLSDSKQKVLHPIDHKGGAFRAALKLNLIADANKKNPTTVRCFTGGLDTQSHSFEIVITPDGNWAEKTIDHHKQSVQLQHFAHPEELASKLKTRAVVGILSQPLGLI